MRDCVTSRGRFTAPTSPIILFISSQLKRPPEHGRHSKLANRNLPRLVKPPDSKRARRPIRKKIAVGNPRSQGRSFVCEGGDRQQSTSTHQSRRNTYVSI